MSAVRLPLLKNKAFTAPALAAVLCGLATHAAAQQKPGPGGAPEGSTWGLGLAAMSEQKAYAGMDRDNKALPLLMFENKYVRVFGPRIEAKLPSPALSNDQRLDFRILGQYDGSGYEADDAPILRGMAERKGGFWAGAGVKWHNDIATLSADWTADASSHSKGQRFSLGLERTWRLGQSVMLTPRLGAHWLDKKYVDYYYGVKSTEVAAGRPLYLGKSGVNAEVGVRAMYRIDAHQSVLMDVGVTSLAKGIKDSPLVDRSSENRLMLGYMYRF